MTKFICFLVVTIVVMFGFVSFKIINDNSAGEVEKRALHAEKMKQACLPPSAIVEEKQGDWWKIQLNGKKYLCGFSYKPGPQPYITSMILLDEKP